MTRDVFAGYHLGCSGKEEKDPVRLDESYCINPCRKQRKPRLKWGLQKQTGWDRGEGVNRLDDGFNFTDETGPSI